MSGNRKDVLVPRIEELKKAIRRKYRLFKQGTVDTEQALEKQYKPLISELRKTKHQPSGDIKDEIKKEEIKEEAEESEQDFSPDVYSSPMVQQRGEQVFETTPPDLASVLATPEGVETASRYISETFEHPLTRKYMTLVFKGRGNQIDNIYGPRMEGDSFMLGNKHLTFDDNGKIIVDSVHYKGTEGLYELIFKRMPDDSIYDDEDLQMYKDILIKTSAHRKDYNPKKNIKRTSGATKYKLIIK